MIRMSLILVSSFVLFVSAGPVSDKGAQTTSLISLSSTELAIEESSYEADRKKREEINKKTIQPFWARSCVSEVHEKRNRDFPVNLVSENGTYIFFSLTELHDDKTNQSYKSLNFYKSKDFSGKPVFSIDKEGLKKEGVLICSWNLPYSEAYLYNLSFQKCNHEFVKNLSARKLIGEEGNGPGDYCHILSPSKLEKDHLGNYSLQFHIGKEAYYLDTREMEKIRNGSYIFSPDLIAEKLKGQKTARALLNKDVLVAIANHPMFSRLKLCLKSSDDSCMDHFTKKEFLHGLAADADKKLCGPGCLDHDEIKKCVQTKKDVIRNASKKVAREFVKYVENDKGDLFRINNENGIFTIEYFKNGDPETRFNQKFKVEMNDKNLFFMSYFDGYSC